MSMKVPAIAVKLALSMAVGFLAGFLGSLIGVGGGIIMTPLLTSLVGLSQHRAHGTSLVAVSLSSITGALAYYRGHALEPVAALIVTVGALLTVSAGAAWSSRVDGNQLRKYFGVFVMFAGVLSFLKGLSYVRASTMNLSTEGNTQLFHNTQGHHYSLGFALTIGVVGCIAGFLSGLMGVGGGTIVVPVLSLVGGFSQRAAQGTALMAMVLPAMAGSITHWRLGHVQSELLLGLLTGVSLGSWFGGGVALRLPYIRLLQVSSLLFVLIGARIIVTANSSSSKLHQSRE
ncbi:hypothetical protein CCYA_CCYA10G2935 [Cyanidiococcus yangmingshanensis]|nr:hypothetical protein CCYA_CCYA10G2935 [Cyanidiococcus yangmingshanensis]